MDLAYLNIVAYLSDSTQQIHVNQSKFYGRGLKLVPFVLSIVCNRMANVYVINMHSANQLARLIT